MNRYDDIVERVSLLNAQLQSLHSPLGRDLELRMLLQNQLWSIVKTLNRSHALGLDNHCLDLYVEQSKLVLHFYRGVAASDTTECWISIDRTGRVERY